MERGEGKGRGRGDGKGETKVTDKRRREGRSSLPPRPIVL